MPFFLSIVMHAFRYIAAVERCSRLRLGHVTPGLLLLCLLFVGPLLIPEAARSAEALSRIVTLFNSTDVPDATSRAATVSNSQEPASTVSRPVTAFNAVAIPDASTRIVTAYSRTPELDAVTRVATAYNDFTKPNATSRTVGVFHQECTPCVVVSSDDPATALPVTGTLPDQLVTLNAGPPPYVPGQWLPTHRKDDNSQTAAFRCESVPDPLLQPYLNAPQHPEARDEVTYDNCNSAFYRFVFELPTQYTRPVLVGVANVDDQGVVFLNGNRVTGSMTVPGCNPGPGASDPCYDLQDTGKDRFDAQGKWIMTRGTMDTFAADNPTWFHAGTNELVMAVAGQADYYRPTGVEFNAQVAFQSDVSSVDHSERPELPAAFLISMQPILHSGDQATLSVSMPHPAEVTIRLYGVSGRLVHTLYSKPLEAGVHTLSMSLQGADGTRLASGIYLLRAQAGMERAVARVAIVH